MNDNEIIKGLECCIKDNCDCGECPAIAVCQHDPDCPKTIALALINRQKAEMKNLKKVAEHQQSLAMERHFEIERLKAEIERLKKLNDEGLRYDIELMKREKTAIQAGAAEGG